MALVEAGGEKNPSFAQADQHVSSGWKVRPKCLPKRKRCSSIVSMADKGPGARTAGAAAFVSMADGGASARIAGAAAFVSMADGGAGARIVWAAAAMRVPCASETVLGLRVHNQVSGQLQALATEVLTCLAISSKRLRVSSLFAEDAASRTRFAMDCLSCAPLPTTRASLCPNLYFAACPNKPMVVSKAVNAAALAGKARMMVGRKPRVKPLTPLFGREASLVTRKH